jgi:hypothetical protein
VTDSDTTAAKKPAAKKSDKGTTYQSGKVKNDAWDEAHEQGFFGGTPDEIDNDEYTVAGQGEDTAAREREQIGRLRAARFDLNDG